MLCQREIDKERPYGTFHFLGGIGGEIFADSDDDV